MTAALLALLLTLQVPTPAAPVWIEGEAPAKFDAPLAPGGWGRAATLSGKQWLWAAVEAADVPAKVPADGLSTRYDFRAPAAGPHRVHARIGYEFARSPFRWRIDAGEWHPVSPQELTTDLMAPADFTEVAWLELGTAELTAGPHALEFNVPKPKAGERLLFALDCICLSRDPFAPNGPHRPGALWKYPLDYVAEKVRFEFAAVPTGTPPEARQALDLAGTWQTARYDEQTLNDRTGPIEDLPRDLEALNWRGIRVPGDRDAALPEWAYAHRYLYRTKVRVPADLAGRALVLRFPNNALTTTVWVNGTRVGFSKTPCAPFECDATAAVKFGGTNEIVVGIKDHYYGLAKTADDRSPRYGFALPHDRFYNAGGLGATKYADFPTMYKVRRTGILEAPTLTAVGRVYTSDVFAQPSVALKHLTLTTTVENPGPTPVTVEVRHAVRALDRDGVVTREALAKPDLAFAPKSVTVAAGASEVVTLTQPWAAAKLWWPDDPRRYAVETTLAVAGKPIDQFYTPFGFREWGTRGKEFTLNGVPWHGRADLRHTGRQTLAGAEVAVKEWRKNGQTMTRFWGEEPWAGASQADTLTVFDMAGVPVRRSGIFDGEVASYQLVEDGQVNAALFANWRLQLAAWVKAERNHPSVMVWSLENEVTYINARNFGWLKQVEPEMKKAADLVRQLDPTRPVMIDGGDALLDNSLPVIGNHYLEQAKRDYPDEAYTLSKAYARPDGWDPWPIARDKPLFLGESFFANGAPPSAYSEVLGEVAFLGRAAAAPGVTRFARMLSEGYRTHGVAAFHFWFAEGADADHHKAWQPVAVFTREWNTAWPTGVKYPRTLTVFNDTRDPSAVTVYWILQPKGRAEFPEVRGKQSLSIPLGEKVTLPIALDLPAVPAGETVEADYAVVALRGGKEVFRDVKRVRLLGAVKPLADPVADAVTWDPAGKLPLPILNLVRGKPIASLDDVPKGTKLLVVGPDAVTPDLATSPKWLALAAGGCRVVVFDQTHPLHYQALPADLEPTTFSGRIAFPEDPTHPAFTGLTRDDFLCFSGDHVVYRNAYRKATRGGRSLLQCDAELGCTALVELPVGDGLLLLDQTPLGAKPDDPVALRLAANLIRYAAGYQRRARPTVVVLPEADPRRQLLAASGLKFTATDDPVAALEGGEVVIVDGTPANLAKLVTEPEKLKAFAEAGRKLMLWGVTPEALADFNKLVGFDHAMRPFKVERVAFPPVRDALVAGLSLRDVALESTEKIYPWAGDRYPAADTFTHVVDLDDAAPFVKSPGYADGWSKMTDGLTSADSWKFVFYHDQAQAGLAPSWAGTLAKAEEVTGLTVVVNADYRAITSLRVVFDGRTDTAVTLKLEPVRELVQTFEFAPRKCRKIALEPVAWTDGSKPVIGIDSLRLKVRRPADFTTRVVPLLNIGGIVSYPPRGILLNQLCVDAAEANPENAVKKRNLVATLLRNLGAEFAPARLLIPGANLASTPVPLGDKCNAYLSADKGWLAGQPGFDFFPAGEQKFAGVRYLLRDFTTSPLPSAVMLQGPASKSVAVAEVADIPVNRKADALEFLHTFHPAAEPKSGETPTVFEYVVTLADGRTVTVPVAYRRGVGPWLAPAAKTLPQAAVAWSAKFPEGKGPADKVAVVYQMTWTNPHPDTEIRAVTLRRAPGPPLGTPILFAVTASTLVK